jgi:transcriptional regulator with XRE-family HTH domain
MELGQVISGPQIRAARALLDLTAADLAEDAGISLRSLQRFEASEAVPDAQARLLERLKNSLEAAGVEFLGDPVKSPGVQLKRPDKPPAKSRAKR